MSNAHWTIGNDYSVEYATEAEAKAAAELRFTDCCVITWVRDPFDKRCCSCGMQRWQNGAWRGINIHE